MLRGSISIWLGVQGLLVVVKGVDLEAPLVIYFSLKFE